MARKWQFLCLLCFKLVSGQNINSVLDPLLTFDYGLEFLLLWWFSALDIKLRSVYQSTLDIGCSFVFPFGVVIFDVWVLCRQLRRSQITWSIGMQGVATPTWGRQSHPTLRQCAGRIRVPRKHLVCMRTRGGSKTLWNWLPIQFTGGRKRKQRAFSTSAAAAVGARGL